MTSKEKFYNNKRVVLMRSIIFLSEDLVLGLKKGQLRFIDLKFLKETEQQLKRYYDLLIVGSKIPIKEGVSSE